MVLPRKGDVRGCGLHWYLCAAGMQCCSSVAYRCRRNMFQLGFPLARWLLLSRSCVQGAIVGCGTHVPMC